ncbi:MAG: flagellar filament capping protein FliD, partial [Arcobacteraceae bacterium]|nr:flagellar filament capping protein FliD [Arcobacteraceae bacterium]
FSSAVLTAQNMEAQVDGIDYDVSSNTITIQGNLTMTAIETGTSTISVQQDDSTIMPTLEDFVTTYNELVTLVDDELYSADSPIEDLGSLRMMMGSIKDMLFDSYGDTDEENIFNYGFSLDETGYMSLDAEIFGAAVSNNFDNLKELFIGKAEDEGLGTALKSYLDGLDSYDGLLSSYGERMADRKTTLEEDKEEAQTALDSKYSLMSLQFASYTAIITQMENSFGGMKMMMDQSTAS